MISIIFFVGFFCSFQSLKINQENETPYTIEPLWPGYGASVAGFDLGAEPLSDNLIASLKRSVQEYGVLVFRGTSLTPEQQHFLSNKLGTTESIFGGSMPGGDPSSTSFVEIKLNSNALATAQKGVLRISNNVTYGDIGVETSFHNHGGFAQQTYPYILLHSVKSAKGTPTSFISMKELFKQQLPEVQQRWRDIHYVEGNGMATPLVYKDSEGEDTMFFDLSTRVAEKGYVQDLGLQSERILSLADFSAGLQSAIDDSGLVHNLEWGDGDVAIVDNLAIAHKGPAPNPGSHALRLLDLTNVRQRCNAELGRTSTTKPVSVETKSKLSGKSVSLLKDEEERGNSVCPEGRVFCTLGNIMQKSAATPEIAGHNTEIAGHNIGSQIGVKFGDVLTSAGKATEIAGHTPSNDMWTNNNDDAGGYCCTSCPNTIGDWNLVGSANICSPVGSDTSTNQQTGHSAEITGHSTRNYGDDSGDPGRRRRKHHHHQKQWYGQWPWKGWR